MKKAAFGLLLWVSTLFFAPPSWAITTAGSNPNDPLYLAPAGSAFDGVARLTLTFTTAKYGCSGALLSTGLHLLTAAHCVSNSYGAPLPISSSAAFVTESGTASIAGLSYAVNPLWDGNLFSGTDLAVITLAALAPTDAERYEINRDTNEAGQIGTLSGFGTAGSGATGPTLGFGTRRKGMNKIDALGSFFSGVSNRILMGDFDSGLTLNDAFGFVGLPDLGLGLNEVNIAPGDSGGPTFLNGKIAGIHSFGATFGLCPPDVVTPSNLVGPAGCKLDFSFGEFFGDTRVSSFQDFIDASAVPEPGTLLLISSGLAGLVRYLRRNRTR